MSSANPLVPGLIYRRGIHLLIGASKSGKTNLLLPQLDLYAAGESFMGYRVGGKPEQIGGITCSKNSDDAFYHIRDLGLEHLMGTRVFPTVGWKPAPDVTDRQALDDAYMDLCRHANSPVKFLIVDGFQKLMTCGKPNDLHATQVFFREINQFCATHDVTILGTTLTAKMKRGESYPQLSEKVYGSSTWAEEASTLIGIEVIDLNLPMERRSGIRRVSMQPQWGEPVIRYANFDEKGKMGLIDTPDAAAAESANHSHAQMDRRLDCEAPGSQFTRDQLLEWGDALQLSKRTVDSWIASRSHEDIGMLAKVGKAKATIYIKPVEH